MNDVERDRLTPGSLVHVSTDYYPLGHAVFAADEGDFAAIYWVRVSPIREAVPWDAIAAPREMWATPTPRNAAAALLAARDDAMALTRAAMLAGSRVDDATLRCVREAVPAAPWRTMPWQDYGRAQVAAQVGEHGADVILTAVVRAHGVLRWSASLDYADWSEPAVTADGVQPDPRDALRDLFVALRHARRRIRRHDKRRDIEDAETALSAWLFVEAP